MRINKILELLYYIGMFLVLAGLVLKLNDVSYSVYIYAAGVLPVLGVRVFNITVSSAENRRKNFILGISAFFLASAAVGMYLSGTWWIVPIAIAAGLDLYISFRRFR
ncbi:MAG: hypothetical protein LBV41_12520 [Cytophagaceae bacterium]|jgi:hypothetical protein|nr:hypothetical protein [Cytophagaceae bacterium]